MDTQAEHPLRARLRALYNGVDVTARRFRLGLLAFDIATVLFFVVSSMFDPAATPFAIDVAIAAILTADLAARWWIAPDPARFPLRFAQVLDILVIASLLAPVFVESLAFLRVVRMLRILRSYHVTRELRQSSPWFRKNEDVIHSSLNLAVFVFVITAIVYVLEGHRNPNINNYFDALYFTVTTLTTTGFGDITMTDTLGRMLSVVIMVVGVSLFLRLVQTIFRPPKVRYSCPDCGLSRHDTDAVHCKHCGRVLNIPNEGV